MTDKKKIIIVGGGPSGLFCAFQLLKRGYKVELYDHMSAPGKKFLVAGNGGLNLTHSERIEDFTLNYGKDKEIFRELLSSFSNDDLRSWCDEIGVETFIGSSGRVFPTTFKAADVLKKWLTIMKSNENFSLHLKHKLIDISQKLELTFLYESEKKIVDTNNCVTILALGGASYKKTGSDGLWIEMIKSLNINVADLEPMNCGFDHLWSDFFIEKIDRAPLKNLSLSYDKFKVFGEIMITPFGLEGGAVYALSSSLRNKIKISGAVDIFIDLKPHLSLEDLTKKILDKKKKDSLSNFLRKSLKITKEGVTLINELSVRERLSEVDYLASQIKKLKITLNSCRPVEEAISTSGGVTFDTLNKTLECSKYSDLYFAGEMLDFEAPTGGYLLQGCFSTAWRVVDSIVSKDS
jgi:uncharacterized flavoprotein (TIGR03862 family)